MKALDALIEYGKDGDVINIDSPDNLWSFIPHTAIRLCQKDLFHPGDIIYGNNQKYYHANNDTHSMLYFEEGTFSVELPESKIIKKEDYKTEFIEKNFTLYRYTYRPFTKKDIRFMQDHCQKLSGIKYDWGQLIDILICQLCGYPYKRKHSIFDIGKRNLVCSVGVGAVYTALRHNLENEGIQLPRLFSKLNKLLWDTFFVLDYEKKTVGSGVLKESIQGTLVTVPYSAMSLYLS